jgi:hypothetical protein
MARKIVLISLFISFQAWPLTLTAAQKKYELIKNDSGFHLSSNCQNCKAWNVFKTSKKKFQAIMEKEKNHSLSISTRICLGLDGLIWLLDDEKKNEVSLCELSDKSYVLTEDLAKYARSLGLH